MASISTTTDVEVAAIAIDIQSKLRQADELLAQAHRQADELVDSACTVSARRFGSALTREADWISDYLGPDHASSVFDIPDAIKALDEFLELLAYAVKEDN